jgi:hypothetical protein
MLAYQMEETMDWVKKHIDTVAVLGGLLSSVLWMNGKFNEIDRQFANVEKEMAVIKTVLIMKGIFPTELAVNENSK